MDVWISAADGSAYKGDCSSADRAATVPEAAAYHLAKAQREKARAIAKAFDTRVARGMPFGGKVLQIRADDRDLVNAVFGRAMAYLRQLEAPLPGIEITWPQGGFLWRMLDNSYLRLTPAEFADMAQRAADYYGALFYVSRALKDAVGAATSLEELAAIDVTAGWPE